MTRDYAKVYQTRRSHHPGGKCLGPPLCNKKHGKYSHYSDGCRCEDCTADWARYYKEWRENNRTAYRAISNRYKNKKKVEHG